MMHAVLLLSRDDRLAARVGRALAPAVPAELHCSPELAAAGERDWLLILLDARVLPAESGEPQGSWPGGAVPVLWLGDRPVSGEIWERLAGAQPGPQPNIVDYLRRDDPASKLAYVLHQHLAAAYLRHQRAPRLVAAASADPAVLQRQLNNALTGILGNAALALDGGRRLPTPLSRRLQRIVELAGQMRETMAALPVTGARPEVTSHPKAA